MSKSYHYGIAYVTDPGNVRKENEDSLLIRKGSLNGKEFAFLAVADGMGGLSNGADASGRAVHFLDGWWDNELPEILEPGFDWDRLNSSISAVLDQINWSIFQQSDHSRSGTTMTAAFVYRNKFCVYQIGDSRAYLLKKGELLQVTKDQTFVQREIDLGNLTPEEALRHPKRHALVSALGVSPEYVMESYPGELSPGDCLLLCSDGFYGEMDQSWYRNADPSAGLDVVLRSEKQQILNGRAEDNLTAVLLNFREGKKI